MLCELLVLSHLGVRFDPHATRSRPGLPLTTLGLARTVGSSPMPRRRSKRPISPRAIATLVVLALALFAIGEAYLMLRTDRGQILAARWLGHGEEPRVTQIVSRNIRHGLALAGVVPDSIQELPPLPVSARNANTGDSNAGTDRLARLRWRVGLLPDASLLQANYALTRSLAASGIDVLNGRERMGRADDPQVVLLVGYGGRATHEIVLSRMPVEVGDPAQPDARVAIVVYGFGEDAELAAAFLALPAPFAVALPAGTRDSPGMFKAAREQGREVVLHIPLEPINYPQVDPGPGTILVTMKPPDIAHLVRHYLEQAGPVAAVANHMGSLATQDMTVMAAIFRELHRQRVPFLHVAPAAGSVCKALSSELGVAYAEPDAVIESEAKSARPEPLEKRWKSLLAEARTSGQLVVLVRATARTRTFLPAALDPKRLKGVSIVPLASLLRRPSI